VLQFLPAARSVIVFGKEVPVPVYRMQPGEKTREMLRIAGSLDSAAARLAGLLEAEHIPSLPVPLYLPVRVADESVQGVVRIKQIAAGGGLGEIGKNTLLLNRRFGPLLLLAGVVTGTPANTRSRGGSHRKRSGRPSGRGGPSTASSRRSSRTPFSPKGTVPGSRRYQGQGWGETGSVLPGNSAPNPLTVGTIPEIPEHVSMSATIWPEYTSQLSPPLSPVSRHTGAEITIAPHSTAIHLRVFKCPLL